MKTSKQAAAALAALAALALSTHNGLAQESPSPTEAASVPEETKEERRVDQAMNRTQRLAARTLGRSAELTEEGLDNFLAQIQDADELMKAKREEEIKTYTEDLFVTYERRLDYLVQNNSEDTGVFKIGLDSEIAPRLMEIVVTRKTLNLPDMRNILFKQAAQLELEKLRELARLLEEETRNSMDDLSKALAEGITDASNNYTQESHSAQQRTLKLELIRQRIKSLSDMMSDINSAELVKNQDIIKMDMKLVELELVIICNYNITTEEKTRRLKALLKELMTEEYRIMAMQGLTEKDIRIVSMYQQAIDNQKDRIDRALTVLEANQKAIESGANPHLRTENFITDPNEINDAQVTFNPLLVTGEVLDPLNVSMGQYTLDTLSASLHIPPVGNFGGVMSTTVHINRVHGHDADRYVVDSNSLTDMMTQTNSARTEAHDLDGLQFKARILNAANAKHPDIQTLRSRLPLYLQASFDKFLEDYFAIRDYTPPSTETPETIDGTPVNPLIETKPTEITPEMQIKNGLTMEAYFNNAFADPNSACHDVDLERSSASTVIEEVFGITPPSSPQ